MSIKLLARTGMLLAILSVLLLQGCATTAQKTANMRTLMEQNRHDLALIEAEKQLAEELEGVMENMNVGLLRRLNKDYRGSNEAFEKAKNKIDELYTKSITEQATATLVNDESISFRGYKFEQVLIHMYMAANFLDMGDPDAARVELLQSQEKMDEWGEPKDEVPFMRYFAGIMFELLGEDDSATVSYRKAVDAYNVTRDKHGLNVPLQLKYDLLRMLAKMKLWSEYNDYKRQWGLSKYKAPDTRGKGELIVIFSNGMAPQIQQKIFHTWSSDLSANVKVAIPDYPNPPVVLNKVRLKLNDRRYPLEIVSNIDGMARASLAENMPVITARAIARAVAKKKTEKEAGNRDGLLGLVVMVVNHATEIADTRSWNTLPQEIEIARQFLSPGDYQMELEVVDHDGHVVDTIKRDVSIKAGKKTVVTKRWTSPEHHLPMHPVAAQQQATSAHH